MSDLHPSSSYQATIFGSNTGNIYYFDSNKQEGILNVVVRILEECNRNQSLVSQVSRKIEKNNNNAQQKSLQRIEKRWCSTNF